MRWIGTLLRIDQFLHVGMQSRLTPEPASLHMHVYLV